MRRTPWIERGSLAILAVSLLSHQAGAMEGSGEAWGSRDLGNCNPMHLTSAPTPEQVADMLRCKYDVEIRGELWLIENINVAVGPGSHFSEYYNSYDMENADVDSIVYPIDGAFTWAVCKTRADAALGNGNPDLNCLERDVPNAKGVCWSTVASDWKCLWTGAVSGTREPTSPPR